MNVLDPDLLLERYGDRIYNLARRMSACDADAEDVLQSTLVKVMRRAGSFRGDCAPMGWIRRIAVNEALEIHRARKRRRPVSLDDLPAQLEGRSGPSPLDPLEKRDIDAIVQAAIEELPSAFRAAVVLHDIEGITYEKSAELLDVTVACFKTRLHRARLRLREALAPLAVSADAAATHAA